MTLDDQIHPSPILPLASSSATLPLAGGKGANLACLARAGLPVPGGFTITTRAYQAFAAANGLTERIPAVLSTGSLATPDACEDASARIRDLFGQGSVPADLAEQILVAYAALDRPAVAVRSSATAEDLPEMSFAGQQDTYLNVIGADALLQAVVACWSSLWTARAISYRERNGVAHADVALAVVVQQMVESEASGVLFMANPLTGLRTETVIDASVGLGEALVSGQVEPDHFVVDMSTGQISGRTLGAKALSVRSRPGGGTMTVQEDLKASAALSDAQVLALAALGGRVAALYDAPQDIEWAWANGAFYLLQTRPITSLFPVPAGLSADPLQAMLSFGAVQGMLEPITPLGRNMMFQVVAAAAQLFGMERTAENQGAFYLAGQRLWINLTPLLRNTVGRRTIPGITSWVDPAGGAALDAIWREPRLQPTRSGISRGAARHIAHAAVPLVGLVLLNLLLPDRRRRFIVDRGEHLLRVAAELCAAIQGEPRARLAQLADFAPAFIALNLPPTFRLFVSGVASGMASFNLVRVLTRGLPGITDDRVLEITRGLPNNPTTEMDLALWQISQVIRGDAASRAIFESQSGAALAATYRAGALPAAAQQAFETFMARYGSRGLAEIDMGRPRWSEDPAHVMDVVAGYLRITDPAQAPDAVFARGAAAAAAATDQLVAAARRSHRGRFKARLMRFAIDRARSLMALRESPKFFAVRLFGLIRAELLRAGQELTATGDLTRPDDLCYLSFAELGAFAAGEPADWAALIADRRAAYRREERRRQIPRLLLSDGRAFYAGLGSAINADGASLTGSPVSPGSVEGRVRVVLDPRRADLLHGEIMVCPGTDPSWTPLFLTAAGLVMEVGGLMTHGAVVAREYGIPAIVGVDRATERLRTGQRIEMNGSSGEIRLLDAEETRSDAQSGESA
jgi:rifampicin phosphotransferase